MRAVFETKTINRKLINLEEVSIDVEATQKAVPLNPQHVMHIRTPSQSHVALQYDRILNQTIEDLLVAMSDKTEPNFTALAHIFSLDKKKISYIALLNLEIIQKLQYIMEKINQLKPKFDIELIKIEINYWRELIIWGLTETSDQQIKYGKLHEKEVETRKKTIECQNGHDQVSQEPVKQKVGVKKSEAVESRSRTMRSKGRSKNGPVNQVYDCVDS